MFVLYCLDQDYDYYDLKILAVSKDKSVLEQLIEEKSGKMQEIYAAARHRQDLLDEHILKMRNLIKEFLDRNEDAIKDTSPRPQQRTSYALTYAQGSGGSDKELAESKNLIDLPVDSYQCCTKEWHSSNGTPYHENTKKDLIERFKAAIVKNHCYIFQKDYEIEAVERFLHLDKLQEPLFEYATLDIPYVEYNKEDYCNGEFIIKEVVEI